MAPQIGMKNPILPYQNNRTPSRKEISFKHGKEGCLVFTFSLPWGACLLFLINALMTPHSAFAAETAATSKDAPSHSMGLSIHPAPLPKVPLPLNRQALGSGIRMWFPAYDGDGFFASLDQPKQLKEASLEAESIFQTSIVPIIQSLGFGDDSGLHFFIPRHSGAPSGRANFSKLASRLCAGLKLEVKPPQVSPSISILPKTAETHLVHSVPTSSARSAPVESPAEVTENRQAIEQWQQEWASWWCRVSEQIGSKDRITLLEKDAKPLLEALDRSFQEQTGQTFRQHVEEFERERYFYLFPQVHHPRQDEFAAGLIPPKLVTIDHAGIRADRKERQGIHSAVGRVFVSYKVTNKLALPLANAVKAALTALKSLNGVTSVEDIPVKGVSLVLLPAGEARVADKVVPALRYAYRMPAYVVIGGGRKPVYVWIDAEEGKLLEVVPLFSGAADAKGSTLNADPSGGTSPLPTDFKIDQPTGVVSATNTTDVILKLENELRGGMPGSNSPQFIAENQQLPIPPSSVWDFTSSPPPASGASTTTTLERWEKIDLFGTVSRYLDTVKNADSTFTWSGLLPITIYEGSNTCNPFSMSNYSANLLNFQPYDPNDPNDTSCPMSGSVRKSSNDHTLVAHEMGHLLTQRQYGLYPPDPSRGSPTPWCYELSLFPRQQPDPANPTIACPVLVNPNLVHDFADAWVQVFEDTNCVAGWMGQWIPRRSSLGVAYQWDPDSLFCKKHHENDKWPRLSRVPDPVQFDYQLATWPDADDPVTNWSVNDYFATHIGDHFPEHRRVINRDNCYGYSDMQIAAAALWEVREGAMSLSTWGRFDYFSRFFHTLATIGWLGPDPLADIPCPTGGTSFYDKDIFRGLVDLEVQLANQWTNSTNSDPRSINKVAAGFARAGVFMIHPSCLDSDSTNNDPCVDGDSGGDAIIDVTDNDCDDDRITRGTGNPCNLSTVLGVLHQERDYLKPGFATPGFHVWTGPRYVFTNSSPYEAQFSPPQDVLSGIGTAPICNNMLMIEVAEDEAFTQILTTSGWLETFPFRPCYCNWVLTSAEWDTITQKLEADQKNRIYYRVTTCLVPPGSRTPCIQQPSISGFSGGTTLVPGGFVRAPARHIRHSTAPANGLFGEVPPPYATLNKWGRIPMLTDSLTLNKPETFQLFDIPVPPHQVPLLPHPSVPPRLMPEP